MSLKIRIKEQETGVQLVIPEGAIDTETALDFENAVMPLLDSKAVLLDMTKVSYITSMGLGAIFKVKKTLESRGGILVLSNLQPAVQKVFELIKAIPEYVFATLDQADEYLDRYLAEQGGDDRTS